MAFIRLRGLGLLLAAGGLAAAGALVGWLGFYLAFVRDLPDLRSVSDYRPPLASRVYDRNGQLIGEFFTERRRLTPLSDVPSHVVDAFVAGEDSAFFEHTGIDPESILRAAWVNLRAGGEFVQGGSTITQQMVKGLLLSPERKLRRKVREMILARRIEERFSKQEILYLYLNQIYFGHGAYGIGEAAQIYFGKDIGEISVSEGAQLAGLPKAPSRYSPYANPEQAERRRRYVLERMLIDQRIDTETYEAAIAEVPVLRDDTPPEAISASAYFTEEVRRFLFDELGSEQTLRGGLVIETTVDARLQIAAQQAVRKGLVDLDRRQGYRGHVRQVPASAVPEEIERLARENELAPPEAADPPELAEALEIETEVEDEGARPAPGDLASSDEPVPPEVPADRALLGVVTAVDTEEQIARVAFAPGVEGVVHLADVAWARKPDPSIAPRPVKSIDAIFAKGDVARFERIEPEAAAEEVEAEGENEVVRLGLEQEPLVQGAIFSIDVATGDVLALVGGFDFETSQFNRVTQARRQPGSAFKPLIYCAALARGYTPVSILYDRPVVYVDEASGFIWRPRNYGRSFYGPITLREALVRSVNNATVHLFRDVGVDFVIDYTRRLGIESPLNRDLSLALGSSDVSLLELTRAYATFPAGGRRVTPIFVRRVTDRDGQILFENVPLGDVPVAEPGDEGDDLANVDVAAADPNPHSESGFESDSQLEGEPIEEIDPDQLIPPEQAYLATALLRAVVTDPKGTGWRLRALRRPVAGKTGTTNDQADAWFMGFSPDIMTGVWVGHDESHFLGWGETGSRAAAPIWVDYMRVALEGRPVRDFAVPEPIVFARIDRKTGLIAGANSTDTIFQAFVAGTEPSETDTTARNTSEDRRLLRLDGF
jgi:penicillin-binding protein 1A